MTSAAASDDERRRHFHEQRREAAFRRLRNPTSPHDGLSDALDVMRYSLAEFPLKAPAVQRQFKAARDVAFVLLRTPLIQGQLQAHEQAWYHLFRSVALFQECKPKEANKELSVSETCKRANNHVCGARTRF